MNFNKKDQVNNSFEMIKTKIKFLSNKNKMNTFVITSTRHDSGKTLCASRLANTLASDKDKVLLVDANFYHSDLHRLYNLDNSVGLSDLVNDSSINYKDIVHKIDNSNLYILTSGGKAENIADLMYTDNFARFMEIIANEFDYVIFDTPSVLPDKSEAIVLGQMTCGLIIVVPLGKEKMSDLDSLALHAKNSGVKIIGAIYNENK